MTDKDMKEFAGLFITMYEIFGSKNRNPSKMLITAYFNALKDYSIDEVRKGISSVIQSHKYDSLPKPAQIIQHITGDPEAKALLAWDKFLNALRQHGYYRPIQFDDPVIHSVIQAMGGWLEAGEWLEDDLRWHQQRFVDLYKALSKKKKHPEYLPGIYELHNNVLGLKTERVFIGEQKMIEAGADE